VTTRQVDVLIVGGGPAGLSTALHLQAEAAELVERTVVLEKQRYPRDKICGGAIGARALRRLAALRVTIDVPMVELDAIALRVGGQVVTVREPGLGVVVRRIEFDHALARAAIARGIEVRDGCGVTSIAVGDRGVLVETDTGETYDARVVVGADGVGGVVRRQAGFPRGALRAQVVELDTEEIPGDPARDTIAFDFEALDLAGYAWDFPTIVDGRALMCRGVYLIRDARDDARAPDAAGPRIDAYLTRRNLDPSRYRKKQFAERGFEPGAEIAKPRVLLVGEAAGIDIATGEGIAQAIEYGAVAGPYLARAIADDDLGFADWRRRIDVDHVGWQLRVRHACFRAFYGNGRTTLERIVPRLATLLQVGARDFAGVPLDPLDLVRGGAQLFAAVAREGLRRSVR
jgi:flavin-dependent dehydrogenase